MTTTANPDHTPAFTARSPKLTAERLKHAQFMQQHWYAMYRNAVAEVVRLRERRAACWT